MSERKKRIFVLGHKNPDSDSICSAIAYANLKNALCEEEYVATRAGQVNEETQYILSHFGIDAPLFISNVQTQVRDIEFRETEGVPKEISLKKAWTLMKDKDVMTLPITEESKLVGIITIGDIATAYMDVYDSKILATAKTQYQNILETLDAKMIVGEESKKFTQGKVLIAAANPDLMESYIEPHDLVILGNRYESQLCAIEMQADCIIVSEGATVSMTIKKLAEEKHCTVISTPHDTYTVARLLNQSMPIEFFMRKDNMATFQLEDCLDAVKEVMAKKRHRYFPILDRNQNCIGMISRRNLLDMSPKKVIMVDHNEKSQAVDGIEDAEILEIIDHHRLGNLETISPVFFRNQPLGCTATIVYQMYKENRIEISKKIASLLCAAIISDTLMYRSPTCTKFDTDAAKELAKLAEIDVEELAAAMFNAGSNLKSKSPEEIFYQDYKRFSMNEITFGVGQINAMTEGELDEIKERMTPYIKQVVKEKKVDMVYFMLTNITKESTELLYVGGAAKEAIEDAFNVACGDQSVLLPGVISRKKQLIPALMSAMQQ
ncbi:MAG: putative manganese-dependent inorganic diphosphatase [Lachnospiraceae bacterium]